MRDRGRGPMDTFRSHQTAETGPEVVAGQPARDPDGDGLYEDVNGDGEVTVGDADVLIRAIRNNNPAVVDNPELFDFNGDGQLTEADAETLFNNVLESTPGPIGENGGTSPLVLLGLAAVAVIGVAAVARGGDSRNTPTA